MSDHTLRATMPSGLSGFEASTILRIAVHSHCVTTRHLPLRSATCNATNPRKSSLRKDMVKVDATEYGLPVLDQVFDPCLLPRGASAILITVTTVQEYHRGSFKHILHIFFLSKYKRFPLLRVSCYKLVYRHGSECPGRSRQ